MSATTETIDEQARGRIAAELAPSERLIWSGRPIPKSRGDRRAVVLFAVPALGLAAGAAGCYALWLATADIGDDFLRCLAGGFYGASIYAMVLSVVAGFVERYVRARRVGTLYALTDRRAILWRPGRRRGGVQVHSFPLDSVGPVHRVESADGSGDLVFFPGEGRPAWQVCGFEHVAGVARLDALFREALASAPSRGPRDGGDGWIEPEVPPEVGLTGTDPDFDEPLSAEIKADLAPDEKILWAGRPPLTAPGDVVLTRTLLVALAVLLVGSLAAYLAAKWRGEVEGAFLILSMALRGTAVFPGVLLVLFLILDRFGRASSSRTRYVLTDRRALWFGPSRARSGRTEIRSVETRSIAGTRLDVGPDGAGDLIFLGVPGRPLPGLLAFRDVPDVARVERLLRASARAEYLPRAGRPVARPPFG